MSAYITCPSCWCETVDVDNPDGCECDDTRPGERHPCKRAARAKAERNPMPAREGSDVERMAREFLRVLAAGPPSAPGVDRDDAVDHLASLLARREGALRERLAQSVTFKPDGGSNLVSIGDTPLFYTEAPRTKVDLIRSAIRTALAGGEVE